MSNNSFYKTLAAIGTLGIVISSTTVVLTSLKKQNNEIITNLGIATSSGNSCPMGYAYIGNGYCSPVLCADRTTEVGITNNQIVAGKKWRCFQSFFSTMSLMLGPDKVRIGNDPKCPGGQPELGWTSTCEAPYIEPPKDKRTFGTVRR